jgi:hypothetical protein
MAMARVLLGVALFAAAISAASAAAMGRRLLQTGNLAQRVK